MSSFKEFLDAVERGEVRRDLFLFDSSIECKDAVIELFSEANERHLCALASGSRGTVVFAESFAVMRVAHVRIDEEMRAFEFTAIHGLDALSKHERSVEMRANLLARIR